MAGTVDIAAVGTLLADRARAGILAELLGGEPLPAGELARRAGVSPSGASNHLRRLLDGGLVVARSEGRRRVYRLAGEDVAAALEALGRLAPERPPAGLRAANAREAFGRARTCYDHLAGRLGVGLTRTLLRRRVLRAADGGFAVTPRGAAWLGEELGIDVAAARDSRRAFALRCLDLTEREPHLAGALGAAVASAFLARDLARRAPHDRSLRLTQAGERWLADLGVAL